MLNFYIAKTPGGFGSLPLISVPISADHCTAVNLPGGFYKGKSGYFNKMKFARGKKNSNKEGEGYVPVG
jgi:hypothetical protein